MAKVFPPTPQPSFSSKYSIYFTIYRRNLLALLFCPLGGWARFSVSTVRLILHLVLYIVINILSILGPFPWAEHLSRWYLYRIPEKSRLPPAVPASSVPLPLFCPHGSASPPNTKVSSQGRVSSISYCPAAASPPNHRRKSDHEGELVTCTVWAALHRWRVRSKVLTREYTSC